MMRKHFDVKKHWLAKAGFMAALCASLFACADAMAVTHAAKITPHHAGAKVRIVPGRHAASPKDVKAIKGVKGVKSAKDIQKSNGHAAFGRVGKHKLKGSARFAAAPHEANQASQADEVHTVGQLMGLHNTPDALKLNTGAAVIVDAATQEVVYAKNADVSLPMASITKLMTALLVVESGASWDDELSITQDDVDTERNSSSRLPVGTHLSRGDMLHLALMSSENRAAHALARSQPGGLTAFVAAMNAKAKLLGMAHTTYVDPTGLSNSNRASPLDISRLAQAASEHEPIRRLSTSNEGEVDVKGRRLSYHSSNEFIRTGAFGIVLQKTGYIKEAGRCMVMEVQTAGRRMVMVLLDSVTPGTRRIDARKLHQYAEQKALKFHGAAGPAQSAPIAKGLTAPTVAVVSQASASPSAIHVSALATDPAAALSSDYSANLIRSAVLRP